MYILISIMLVVLSFLQIFNKKTKYLLFPFLILLIMISGFRYQTGKDYIVYEKIFTTINSIDDYPLIEIGFKYIVLFLKSMSFNSLGIFFILSTISLLLYYKAIIKQTKYTYFSFLIFFNTYIVTSIFSGIRQGLVMGIFLFLLNDIYHRKFFKVLIGTIIAFSIHVTGILILLIYFFPRNLTIKKEYIIIFLFLSLGFIYIDLTTYIVDSFPSYIQMKFYDYSKSFNEKVNFMRVLQRLLLIVPFLIYYDKVKKNKKLLYFFYIYLMGFFIYILFSFNLAFATKINQFFRVLEIILIPMLFELLRNKSNKIIFFIFIIIWSTLILILFLNIPENSYKIWNSL